MSDADEKLPFDEGYLVGLLIGDGKLIMENTETCFYLYNTNQIYVQWLKEMFGDFVNRVEEDEYTYRNEVRESYKLFSKPHPRLDYYGRFYDDDGAFPIPENTGLSPEALKMWHASDGTLNWSYGSRNPTLQLATDTKQPAEEKYSRLFEDIGVELKSSSKSFRFHVDETRMLLEYMGQSVPGYEYKWENSSEDQYKKVKRYSG